ncbi:hypothetical protein C0993_010687 [Termitomyces sp. T159_Od127]|nr:hypothetical protein C0993_010687 [Termitomyces sp. T159_Od127]
MLRFPLLLAIKLAILAAPSSSQAGWHFVQNATTGIVPLEAIVVSPTLVLLFDRVENDPLQINGAGAWGAFWNLDTNTETPISLISNTFCASGGFLSNGTMVSVGGNDVENPETEPDTDGRMMIRLLEPCNDADGVGCRVIEDPVRLRLAVTRWYPGSLRIFDGSLMIIGGMHDLTLFYNTDPVNSYEFFPPKDNGQPRPSAFLQRTPRVNLFPRAFALPDGKNATTGIVPLEAIVVSPTLVLLFDRVENDPLQINGAGAWGAFWNLDTNTETPISLISNTFCASGGFLSNGTMVSVGGTDVENPETEPDTDGRMMIRLLEPCNDAEGVGCRVIEDPVRLRLAETRWYPGSLRIFDGSLMIIGGMHELTLFYNTDPVNSYEFFPPKDNGQPRPSAFLQRTPRVNLFPRAFALPDGKVFMIANNQTIIYDVETDTETRMPDIPNGVRVTNPFDGTATLLPLRPPHYVPEVLVCGGSNSSDTLPPEQLDSQDPASDQCSRLVLTAQGIQRGWVVEHMPVGRMMSEMLLMPDGMVLIISGGATGYAAVAGVANAVGNSNCDHPA